MTSAAMEQLCQGGGGGRKEQSREVGATPQPLQHYFFLNLFSSESHYLLKFLTVMHLCQIKYSADKAEILTDLIRQSYRSTRTTNSCCLLFILIINILTRLFVLGDSQETGATGQISVTITGLLCRRHL